MIFTDLDEVVENKPPSIKEKVDSYLKVVKSAFDKDLDSIDLGNMSLDLHDELKKSLEKLGYSIEDRHVPCAAALIGIEVFKN